MTFTTTNQELRQSAHRAIRFILCMAPSCTMNRPLASESAANAGGLIEPGKGPGP